MKSNKILLPYLLLALATGCSSSSGGGPPSPSPVLATLVSIAVTPANPSIALGTTEQFIATGTYSDKTTKNLTTSVTWSSSATSVATISNASGSQGMATSVSQGTATITATFEGISGSPTTLTVTAVTLVSIMVTPANQSIAFGTTEQFIAMGTYSDNATTKDLTTSVTWSSSAPAVAMISNATGSIGLATAIAAGTTMITATLGNVTGSALLTVTSGTPASADNVLPITVNGSLCSPDTSAGYLNKPCVSVTVCTPGSTTACQTINDILLDTGSYGLRIFKQASPTIPLLTVSLPTVTSGSGSLANCALFADLSADWGPVKLADVVLGNDRAVNVPIQVIDASFGTVPTSCGTPDQYPTDAGFNGILGVGLLAQDCGSFCQTHANSGLYYSCNGTTCSATTVLLANQVSNPVVSLPTDSNGIIVQLPSVPLSGSPTVNGMLVLGIGTRNNNTATGSITPYSADESGEIQTVFSNTTYSSIVDSGSNGLFFVPPSSGQLPDCSGSSPDWFCPLNTVTLSATNEGAFGSTRNNVMFQIGNFDSLTNSPTNMVFSDIGGDFISDMFDWGLPFYFGRNIYVGIEGQGSSLGIGPYLAY